MNKVKPFESVLAKFETDEMKSYAEDMLNQTEDYIFSIPSSTTLKYHNKTQCQDGGQVYHILMACEIMNHILDLDYVKTKYSNPKQRDCLRTAILLHDMKKLGEKPGKYTSHDHPVVAQKWIEETVVDHDIELKFKKYIGRLVASHSGQWTTSKRSNVVLPGVDTDEQFLVHLCDYLGSRSNLDMIYSEETIAAVEENITKIDPKELVMPFGMHKGTKVMELPLDYMKWCLENLSHLDPQIRELMEDMTKGM